MLHNRLKAARQAKGLTQQEVAEALGIAQGFVSRLERGEKRPNVALLTQLANLYGVTETQLIGSEVEDERAVYVAIGRMLADPGTPQGLRELAEDKALLTTLGITLEEWLALRSVALPHPTDKGGYVQLLATIRGISQPGVTKT